MAEVSLVTQGRMIAALRRPTVGPDKWHPRLGRYVRRRRFSDAEIQSALHMYRRRFNRAVRAYEKTQRTTWTPEALAERVLAFALKEGRWPNSAEMDDPRKRPEGLPARSAIARHFSTDWQHNEPSLWRLVRTLVDRDETRDKLTPALILSIRNVTVRRAAMEAYGVDRLLREGGGERVQEDDYGTLWRLPTDNPVDDHAQYVEVVNSTPEPDGSHAHYFLRVPPSAETAKDAVAWTFDQADAETTRRGNQFDDWGRRRPVLRTPRARPAFAVTTAT